MELKLADPMRSEDTQLVEWEDDFRLETHPMIDSRLGFDAFW